MGGRGDIRSLKLLAMLCLVTLTFFSIFFATFNVVESGFCRLAAKTCIQERLVYQCVVGHMYDQSQALSLRLLCCVFCLPNLGGIFRSAAVVLSLKQLKD